MSIKFLKDRPFTPGDAGSMIILCRSTIGVNSEYNSKYGTKNRPVMGGSIPLVTDNKELDVLLDNIIYKLGELSIDKSSVSFGFINPITSYGTEARPETDEQYLVMFMGAEQAVQFKLAWVNEPKKS